MTPNIVFSMSIAAPSYSPAYSLGRGNLAVSLTHRPSIDDESIDLFTSALGKPARLKTKRIDLYYKPISQHRTARHVHYRIINNRAI